MLQRLIIPALLFSAVAMAQQTPVYVFQGVNVISMESGELLSGQSVAAADGRITAIGPASEVAVPQGAVVIEAAGRYLMPGLAEMHGHVPGNDDPRYLEDVLFLYVANGVTTVRGMQGRTGHLELRESIARHEIIGPRFFTSGPALSGNAVDGPGGGQAVRDRSGGGRL